MEEASFGAWVEQRRKALDLTRNALAQRVGCSPATIRKIEDDERRPSRQIAELLAQALELPPAQHELFVRAARGERAVSALSSSLPPLPPLPAVAATSAPIELPLPAYPLVGREQELAALTGLMERPEVRLLTLTGPGGMGKTRLALELAHRVRSAYPNGVAFVPLAAITDANDLVTAVADGCHLTIPRDADRAALLLQSLRPLKLLLVLDNFEHLLEGVEFPATLLATAPGVRILVTSREPLQLLEEWVFELSGLSVRNESTDADQPSEAEELFLERARRTRIGFQPTAADAAAIVQICRLVEGMPLALELAATWTRTLSCAEIAEQIQDNLDFLATPARTFPERHRSMRAVFEHSWRLLTEREQSVLRKLAVFAGSFTRAAAEHVAMADLATLSVLVNKSLLRHTPDGRYEMHELIRQFAGEQLQKDATEEQALRNRHAEWCLHLAEDPITYDADRRAWLARLEAELGNVRAALRWWLASEPVAAMRLAAALRRFWTTRGYYREGNRWLEQVLAVNTTRNRAYAETLMASGRMHHILGDRERGMRHFEAAIALARELGDGALLAEALHLYGWVLFDAQEKSRAYAMFEESLAVARAAGDKQAMAAALSSLTRYLAAHTIDFELAEQYLLEALALYKELEQSQGVVLTLQYQGILETQRGNYAAAAALHEKTLEIVRQRDAKGELGWMLAHVAECAWFLNDLDKAQQYYTAAYEIFREMAYPGGIIILVHHFGQIARRRGQLDEAEAYYSRSLQMAWQLRDRNMIARNVYGLGGVALARGQIEQAARLVNAADLLLVSLPPFLAPADRDEYAGWLDQVRCQVGDAHFAAVREAVGQLAQEQIVELALAAHV